MSVDFMILALFVFVLVGIIIGVWMS